MASGYGSSSMLKKEDKPPKPKSKEQLLNELDELRRQLGLRKTDGTMSRTKEILKGKGSLSDAYREMREKERQ